MVSTFGEGLMQVIERRLCFRLRTSMSDDDYFLFFEERRTSSSLLKDCIETMRMQRDVLEGMLEEMKPLSRNEKRKLMKYTMREGKRKRRSKLLNNYMFFPGGEEPTGRKKEHFVALWYYALDRSLFRIETTFWMEAIRIIERFREPSYSRLHTIRKKLQLDYLKLLFLEGADPNASSSPSSAPMFQRLFYSRFEPSGVDTIKLFIEFGADLKGLQRNDLWTNIVKCFRRDAVAALIKGGIELSIGQSEVLINDVKEYNEENAKYLRSVFTKWTLLVIWSKSSANDLKKLNIDVLKSICKFF